MTSREASGQRSETVRRANLSTILQELHLHGPLSRSELVSRTGLHHAPRFPRQRVEQFLLLEFRDQ